MSDKTRVSEIENKSKPRKAYIKPHLDALGDLRSWTLGSSYGTTESVSGNRVFNRRTSPIPSYDGVTLPDGSTLLPDGSIIPPSRQPVP